MAEQAKTQAQEAAAKGVDQRAAIMAKRTEDYYAKSAASKPTPTQREIDLMRVGAMDIDAKEDDGSGPNLVPVTIHVPEGGPDDDEMSPKRALGAEGSPKYKTRDVTK